MITADSAATAPIQVDETVRRVRQADFRRNQARQNMIKAALLPLLDNDQHKVEQIFSVIMAQSEY